MEITYIHYLFNNEIEKYKNDIAIIEIVKSYELGAIVRFTCDNEKILDAIFENE